MKDLKLGETVIVNSGGDDVTAIIDYPTKRNLDGSLREYFMTVNNETSFLCRFTNDIKKTFIGGAKYGIANGDYSADNNTLFCNAQFMPEEFIFKLNEIFIRNLKNQSWDELKILNITSWADFGEGSIMLFPPSMHEFIPDGTELINPKGEYFIFDKIKYPYSAGYWGMLPYGFLYPKKRKDYIKK